MSGSLVQFVDERFGRATLIALLPAGRKRWHRGLLDYCKLDTWAMVRLLQRLTALAGLCILSPDS